MSVKIIAFESFTLKQKSEVPRFRELFSSVAVIDNGLSNLP